MKIYPIISSKNTSFKKDIKAKEISSQRNRSEKSSLEALSNYNKGSLLAFRGESNQSIKNDCEKTLKNQGYENKTVTDILSNISSNPQIAEIQKEGLNSLLKIEEITPFVISQTLAATSLCSNDNPRIAKLQLDLLLKVVESKKFREVDFCKFYLMSLTKNENRLKKQIEMFEILDGIPKIENSYSSYILNKVSTDEDIFEVQKDLIQHFAPIDKMNDTRIYDIVCSISNCSSEMVGDVRDFTKYLAGVDKLEGRDVLLIVSYICASDKARFEIQKDLINTLIKNDRFESREIASIAHKTSLEDYDSINVTKELAQELSSKTDLKSSDISDVLWRIDDDSATAEIQKNTIIALLNSDTFKNNSLAKSDIDSLKNLTQYIRKYQDVDFVSLLKYMEKIDFEKINELAPITKKFSFEDCLKFTHYHFINDKKTDFKECDLKFPTNLDEFLENNYLGGASLNDLFTIFPLTKREVGQIPHSWLNKVSDKEKAKEEIYSVISDFIKNKDLELLSGNLTKILRKEVKINKLGFGRYGSCYQISMSDAYDTCLKIFHNDTLDNHGAHAEPQLGLFANKNSNAFVKMYFGRVAPKKYHDGFLVTQYLDNEVKIDEVDCLQKSKYHVWSADAYDGHNIIQGKIFDFGGIRTDNKETGKEIEPYNFLNTYIISQTPESSKG